MHRILERQIKQHLGKRGAVSPEWKAFFESVSTTYTHLDEDRALLNRSLDLSSKEFLENNRRLEEARIKVEEQAQNLALQVAKRTADLNERIAELEDVRKAMTNLLEDFGEKQKALAEAKAKDDALLESIGEGIVAVDQNGKIILMNHAAEQMLGCNAEQVMGKLLVEVWNVLDEKENPIPETKRPIAAALGGGTATTNLSYFYTRKNGTKFPVAITVTPVLVENKIIGAIDVFRDITKEKEIEKLRMDFLSLASHQLRTPLSGTKWLIETIQRGVIGELNPKQKEYLNNIYQINERMIRLVSDMLNVLMLESGVIMMKKQEVPLSKIYEELLLMMEPAAKNREVKLCNAIKNHKLLFLETDLQILRNILECLISNAINYSQGEQKVTLDVKEEATAVIFSIKDNGIGIPKEEQERISERFYRAANAKAFKPDGTGLGLYTASLLAQKVGGEISFESEENKGTTFYLRVPKKSNSRIILIIIKLKL